MVVFVCFQQGVTEDKVIKAAQTVKKIKLSEILNEDGELNRNDKSGKRVKVDEVSGDILIIPQATLGGKLKGSSVQYHNNIKPEEGESFYKLFCDNLSSDSSLNTGTIKTGVWGARQVLNMQTNGPYSHVFDI